MALSRLSKGSPSMSMPTASCFPIAPISSNIRLLSPSLFASKYPLSLLPPPASRFQRATQSLATRPSTDRLPQDSQSNGANGTALVFLNMGGPSSIPEVYSFLSRLFSDGDLIPLGRFQSYLGPMIARRRTPKIEHQYSVIGGRSPIREWSEFQASETCKILDQLCPSTAPHKPFVMFRYADPLTEDTLESILSQGIRRAVAFTQYPQYSCSTTGSSLNELWRVSKNMDKEKSIKWSVIDRWPTHGGFVSTVARHIKKSLATYSPDVRSKVVLLFSAHSLPMSVVNRGDPYPAEVAASVYAVMEKLRFSNPYRLVWQSQVGPSPWLGAQTSLTVTNYLKKGEKNLLLIPIAFTSDHIETLHELDLEIIKDSGESGVKRVESLNGDREFIGALADIVKNHLERGEACSKQMELRCPMCVSDKCKESKRFFAEVGQGKDENAEADTA